MKVSERRTESRNRKEVIFTINKKPRQFHLIKSIREVSLKTRETSFLYRKPQKLKISKKAFRKLFSTKFIELFSFLGKSHSAEKNQKWPAIAEIIS